MCERFCKRPREPRGQWSLWEWDKRSKAILRTNDEILGLGELSLNTGIYRELRLGWDHRDPITLWDQVAAAVTV